VDPIESNDVDVLREEIRRLRGASPTHETAVLRELWEQLRTVAPDVFVEAHQPTRETFTHLGEVMAELLAAALLTEAHVHQMLRDLRQVSDEQDKLNHFYILLTKNPGLSQTLRDFVVGGRRMGNFANLLRSQQAWARALASGLYKLVVSSPTLIADVLNPKGWQVKRGTLETEDAAAGRYFRESVFKTAPEALGTEFRKKTGDLAYEDYNDLMRRR
jgi:hypothetical protein